MPSILFRNLEDQVSEIFAICLATHENCLKTPLSFF